MIIPLTWGFGAPGGIRTPNLLIRSQMLYPLSYGRLFGCAVHVTGSAGAACHRVPEGIRPCRWRNRQLPQPVYPGDGPQRRRARRPHRGRPVGRWLRRVCDVVLAT